MSSQIFVNLPVKSLDRSVEYFAKLGYRFDPRFTDANATCMVIGEGTFAMLLVEPYFQTFTPRPVADATRGTEVLVALSLGSRDEVDRLVETALGAGGSEVRDCQDHGFMYGRSVADLDGHIWEYFWMDPAGPEA
jgi:predicted lactoylglutathione lyase